MSFDEAGEEFQDAQHHDWANNPECVSVLFADHWSMYCMGGEL